MNKKAVALFSGGLDSILAVRLMLEQGIDVHALNFLTVFCTCTKKGCLHQATKASRELKVPLKVMDVTKEYMEVVKNPKHKRGRNMNPCIDCRVFTFKKAKAFMEEIGASFVITGEVLGERPMSQKKDALRIIENESGLSGLIVRPLSAKLFEPSLPERAGIVDRGRLLDIQGRRRTPQIKLAKELGINEYPCPAGGCLLTDKGFSDRIRDLFSYMPIYDTSDLYLLKTGRHFRISDKLKFMIGRDEEENQRLTDLSKEGDFIFDVLDTPSAVGIARGRVREEDIGALASILARYSDSSARGVNVSYRALPDGNWKHIFARAASDSLLRSFRI